MKKEDETGFFGRRGFLRTLLVTFGFSALTLVSAVLSLPPSLPSYLTPSLPPYLPPSLSVAQSLPLSFPLSSPSHRPLFSLSLSRPLSFFSLFPSNTLFAQAHTCTRTHTHTHAYALSLPPSLSHSLPPSLSYSLYCRTRVLRNWRTCNSARSLKTGPSSFASSSCRCFQ